MTTSKTHPRTPRQGRVYRRRRTLALASLLALPLALSLAALLLAGCGSSPADVDRAKTEIRAVLMDYLPRLAEAYRTGDVGPLADFTTEKEQSIVKRFIREQAERGLTFDTELLDLTIEDLNLVTYSSAYVTTAEHWKVTTRAVGTDQMMNVDPRQFSRVRYQLSRESGHWVILARNRDQTSSP